MGVFAKAKVQILPPHQSVATDLEFGYNMPYGRITIELNRVELSGVEWYSCKCLESDHVLIRPHHGFGP